MIPKEGQVVFILFFGKQRIQAKKYFSKRRILNIGGSPDEVCSHPTIANNIKYTVKCRVLPIEIWRTKNEQESKRRMETVFIG